MIFYVLANTLKLNYFSQWSITSKHSFTVIIGTFIWALLWQFCKVYTGNSLILKTIYSGFYYLVIADLYTFFTLSGSMYNDNIYNKNFHDINYYGTLEMQPIQPLYVSQNNIPKTKEEVYSHSVSESENEDYVVQETKQEPDEINKETAKQQVATNKDNQQNNEHKSS